MYRSLGEGRYLPSEHTQGPWDPGAQHMGPVTALIVHELATTAPRPGLEPARLVVDVFAPVPLAELRVMTEAARDGKRVQCLTASVWSGEREYVRATAWRIRESATPATAVAGPPAPVPPRSGERAPSWLTSGFGYGRALDWRFVTGGPTEIGPATVIGPSGRGLTRSTLYDETGELGTATQTLFVAPR
ncbi:acyl-CoA thioesterase domain-containing protein [Nonomuraea sp. NPDC046802]|uniref:acyl-CoA thioesterase domain-containing protein n=1 Tax=Nonomuraea sp. NPDC046802 TaxID=3154919 RepID=UPI0034039C99